MSDDTLNKIGKKLKAGEGRDAVHFAVAPVVSNSFLRPGERVIFIPNSIEIVTGWNYNEIPPVGIIDPFLDSYISKGDRCWLFLFPNSITGLRHEWTHPLFPDNKVITQDKAVTEIEYSRTWLKGFASRYSGNYESMMEGILSGQGAFFGDDIEYSDFDHGSEFWKHISIVTGKTFTKDQVENQSFRCAC